jgi:hypothetical protein
VLPVGIMIRFLEGLLPDWAIITVITIALAIMLCYSLMGIVSLLTQLILKFKTKNEELRKLRAETKRAEIEARRVEIELINSGTNLRRGLYDIEKSKMALAETQAKLGERFGIPAGHIRTEIFLDHPANDVKERVGQLLKPLSEKPVSFKKKREKEMRPKLERLYEKKKNEILNGDIRVRTGVKVRSLSILIRILGGKID